MAAMRVLNAGSCLAGPALARGKVTVEFAVVLENTDAGQGGDDIEDFFDLGLEVYECGLASPFAEALAGGSKDAQPSAADEFEFSQVENNLRRGSVQDRLKLVLQLRGGESIEAAGQENRGKRVAVRLRRNMDIDGQWHS
jgi:hypothetical protein